MLKLNDNDIKLMNQYIEETRNTVDENRYKENILKIFKLAVKGELFVSAGYVLNVGNYYNWICDEILDIFENFLNENNILNEMYYSSNVENDIINTEDFSNAVGSAINIICATKKTADIKFSPAQQSLKALGGEGKKILQQLEAFKFKLEQAARISGNDQSIAKKIMQNSGIVDKVMSSLYSVIFNVTNIDVVPVYNNEQINVSNESKPDSETDDYKITDELPEEEQEEEIEDFEEPKENEEENNEEEDMREENEEEEMPEEKEESEES